VTALSLPGNFEQMSVIRASERAAHDLFMTGEISGTSPLASGHEAVAVSVSSAPEPQSADSRSPMSRSIDGVHQP
jgi:TPP-dependent pyruvate/acetoin dehydrogenase alpha subunit